MKQPKPMRQSFYPRKRQNCWNVLQTLPHFVSNVFPRTQIMISLNTPLSLLPEIAIDMKSLCIRKTQLIRIPTDKSSDKSIKNDSRITENQCVRLSLSFLCIFFRNFQNDIDTSVFLCFNCIIHLQHCNHIFQNIQGGITYGRYNETGLAQ